MPGFGSRLRDAMVVFDLTVETLADRLGVDRATVYRWTAANDAPRIAPNLIWVLADFLRISARYLMLGEGEPMQRPGLSPDETELIEHLRSIPPEDRTALIEQIRRAA